MMQRVFAVLAAVFLVGAVGLATLAQPDMPLGQMLFMVDGSFMNGLEADTKHYLPLWVWNQLEVPLLVRPAWLIPACIGIVCTGLAVTLAPRRGATRPRRRG
jgi:hypothetical protein